MTEDFGIRNEDPVIQQIEWLHKVAERKPREVGEVMIFISVARNVARKLDERMKVEQVI